MLRSKFGTMVSPQVRHDYLARFGVGTPTAIGFLGEEPGTLHPAEDWDNQTVYTTTFGQAFSVTVPQVASAYQAPARSRRAAATARMTTSGYIAMRWYQHSVHGSKPATSEK